MPVSCPSVVEGEKWMVKLAVRINLCDCRLNKSPALFSVQRGEMELFSV